MTQNYSEELQTRPLLARVLRGSGFGKLCKDEPRNNEDAGTLLSVIFMSGFLLGVVAVMSDWLNLGTWGMLGAVVVALLAVALLGAATTPRSAALFVAVLWAVLAAVQVLMPDDDVLETAFAPFGVTALLVWLTRRGRLSTVARVSPLLLPVTLTVLLIPIFTDDLWRAASELETRHFIFLAFILLVPLVAQFMRQLWREMDAVIVRAGQDALADRRQSSHEAVERLVRLAPDGDKEAVRTRATREIGTLYSNALESDVVAVRDTTLRSLRWRVGGRVIWTAIGLTISVSFYLYLLAWILVPVRVARDWLGEARPVETERLDLLVAQLQAPGAVYVSVAVLLGVVATAVLIGFVLTEERYAGDVNQAVAYAYVYDGMTAALPYAVLRRQSEEAV